MPLGTAKSQGSSGDYISHFGAIRVRVQGSGNLIPTMFGQDEITLQVLTSIPMTATNRFSNFVLSNITEQRMMLELKTTVINDDFTVHRIIIFAKPVATMIPA